MSDFGSSERCVTRWTQESEGVDTGEKYKISICNTGEFYQARIVDPPTPIWSEVGIGHTENEAILALMGKLKQVKAA